MKAMRIGRFSSSRRGGGAARAAADAASFGRRATTASRNWLTPRPWLAETGNTSSKPSENASAAVPAPTPSLSTLFAAISTGLPDLRSSFATSLSTAVTPSRASTTNATTSASSSARSVCCRIAAEDAGRQRIEAAGVDDAEARRPPLADAVAAIARDARLVLDERRLPADQAVEQRRLADVRPPDQRDQRKRFVLGAGAHGAVYP